MIGSGGTSLKGSQARLKATETRPKPGQPGKITQAVQTGSPLKWVYTVEWGSWLTKQVAEDDDAYELVAAVVAKDTAALLPKVKISREEIQAAVENAPSPEQGGVKIGQSNYQLALSGISLTMEYPPLGNVGHMRGGVKDGVGLVYTVNTVKEYEGQGIGKLMAGTFYLWIQKKGATHVQLGTLDTSKGFWAYLQVYQAQATPIETAWANLKEIKVTETLTKGIAKADADLFNNYKGTAFQDLIGSTKAPTNKTAKNKILT
jgi:hypothetical protein